MVRLKKKQYIHNNCIPKKLLIFGAMKKFPENLSKKLEIRMQNNALRQLPTEKKIIDFASNDYLGLSQSDAIFQATHQYLVAKEITQNGATGSRLLSGNHQVYQEAENYIAQFHQAESALIFNSGYDANVGFFSSVPQKGTVNITAPSFKFSKETAALFTKVNDQNYTLAISSGTIEMKDNKVIVLVD